MKEHHVFAEVLEGEAWGQFCDAMKLDFVTKGALMPDVHTGYSLPIGAVVATEGVIVPAWVGFDIGCGMCAVPTTFEKARIHAAAKTIFDQIYRDVPVGFKHNETETPWGWEKVPCTRDLAKLFREKNGLCQLGSLGGGNHFIEIGRDEDERVWIIIHSGSRGIGHIAATHYMRQASKLHTGIEKAKEGHYGFEAGTDLGEQYIMDLGFCLQFALANRREIIERVVKAIQRSLSGHADWDRLINRNHNHAEFNHGAWIHRKGATHAEDGMDGVIPGNMRDGSFIVTGKGNPNALWSSAHGAGRVMGRRTAKETLKLEDFEVAMDGVQAKVTAETLDESPFAYKDIFEVMRLQEPLVSVQHHVRPIINIKA